MRDPRKTLEAKVIAHNRANEVANELHPKLVEIFEPYLGQKITKKDGGLLKKIADQLPESRYHDAYPSPTVMFYLNNSNYSLSFTVKTCAQILDSHGCVYAESTVYVGRFQDGEFSEITPLDTKRTDYNADEVTQLREAYKVAERAARDAESKLYPFGQYDH